MDISLQKSLLIYFRLIEQSEVDIIGRDSFVLEKFVQEPESREKLAQLSNERIHQISLKLTVKEKHKIAFFLFAPYIRWSKPEKCGGEGTLTGGLAFNGGENMIAVQSDFWEDSLKEFLLYSDKNEEDLQLLQQMLWFESPTRNIAVDPIYAPYFGCVLPDGNTFPDKFYFYDGGLLYPLPFKTYEEYILALLSSCAVECWQYFYVESELLLKKNKSLSYMTTQLRHGTMLVENFNGHLFDSSLKIDRMDIIHEYMIRCAKLLPQTFPNHDFNHHKNYIESLGRLINLE